MNNQPFIMIIFGATGDLAQNKLIPALFSLFKQEILPKDFFLIGFSRRKISDSEFRKFFESSKDLPAQAGPEWEEFAKHLTYQNGDFTEKQGYLSLIDKLNAIDKKIGACVTRFFYLATPPQNYETILDFLESTKLSEGCLPSETLVKEGKQGQFTKLIIEKPFGKDLETAQMIDKKLAKIFEERQIFRVDHYLGKETVQNLLAFRFANGIFEPVWNKNFIDHVQITFAEQDGIKNRGKFFDGVGTLRDVGQNHLMQLLAAVTMESPKSFTKEDVRDERAKVIASLKLDGEVIRGQYESYKKEKDVAEDSQTETFLATKLFVNTERFANVPFYIRAGKKMEKNLVEISVVFIQTCHILFKEYGCPEIGNVITFRIQPDEGISLRFVAKKPGAKLALNPVNMDFTYKESFGTKGLEAYEKVLLDIFAGDQILFNRSDELASSWKLITDVLEKWKKENEKVQIYDDNSWGPKEAKELIEKDGKKWI